MQTIETMQTSRVQYGVVQTRTDQHRPVQTRTGFCSCSGGSDSSKATPETRADQSSLLDHANLTSTHFVPGIRIQQETQQKDSPDLSEFTLQWRREKVNKIHR